MTLRKKKGERNSSPYNRKLTGLVLSALFAGSVFLGACSSSSFAATVKPRHVLELFTSQGCSSCPPADALLKDLAKRDDVIAISFPVSYWDYLGWKDTLAKEEFNKRQYDYAHHRGDREIYTPQLIVNGMTHVVGSRPGDIEIAMSETGDRLEKMNVPVSVQVDDGKAMITAGNAPEDSVHRTGKLWIVCYTKSVEIAIGRGENRGRHISYTNVAREMIPVGDWNGQTVQYTTHLPDNDAYDGIAVLLQDSDSVAMLGAATMSIPLR